MDTFVVILVLIILFALLGGTAWFFSREAGPGAGMTWLTGNRGFRSVFPTTTVRPFSARSQTVMVDDSRLHELADELRLELARATALGNELEHRLTALETDFGHTKQLPAVIDARVQTAETQTRERLAKLRRDLSASRKADSPYSVRRNDAISDLYQKLAHIDVALGAVVNPMQLPGEPIAVPEALFEDTLVWDNWGDVADRAYAFGESFSQNRFLLEPALAARIEVFIATFRSQLTGSVYPIVQDTHRTAQQRQQMRTSIVAVVEGIAPLRQEFERTWSGGTLVTGFDDEDPDDD